MTTLLERTTPVPSGTVRLLPAPRRPDLVRPRATWVVVTDPLTGREHPELRWTPVT